MHAALHCSNMCHASYLVTQSHVDCVHPSGKLAIYVLHVLFVATMHAVCLILKRYVCLQVLSRVLEDARHVPSDLAVKSFVSTS